MRNRHQTRRLAAAARLVPSIPSTRRAPASVQPLEGRRMMDGTYHPLSGGDFVQDWSNVGLITANDNWSGVPSVIGYLSGLGTGSGADPRLLTGTSSAVDVNANQTNPVSFQSGGVTEFELPNPVVGMAGSNSAGSPYLMFHVNSTGVPKVDISYNVRDLDSGADNAVQQANLQYRTGPAGTWTNVEGGYLADATTGGSATQVTPIAVTLPDDAGNQAQLEVRVIVGNASGNDEPLGIDDIRIKPTPIVSPPGNFGLDAAGLRVSENAGAATVTVTRSGGSGGTTTVDYATSDLTGTAGSDYTAATGTLTFGPGETSKTITIPLADDALDELNETIGLTISNPTGGAGLSPTTSNVVTIVDADGQLLSAGPLAQDWSNIDLITINDNWEGVHNITGYLLDAEREAGIVDVIANGTNPSGQSQGGVGEFENGDPTIALQGSGAAAAPQLIFDLNTTGVTGVTVAFDAIDLDASADNAPQTISVSYRVGNSGDFIEFFLLEDATEGPSLAGLNTAVSAALPAEAQGQSLVQIRIATTNAAGNDEWVGIDNIVIGTGGVVLPAPVLDGSTYAFETDQAMTLSFSQDIGTSLDAADLVVQNNTLGQILTASAYTVTSSVVGGKTVTVIDFVAPLADGDYVVTVAAGAVSAAGGPSNAADLTGTFFVLGGDANRDRKVDFDDLLILAQNYGQPGKTFSQGNFDLNDTGTGNGTGDVNFDDLLILAQKYNTVLFSSAPIVTQPIVAQPAAPAAVAAPRSERATPKGRRDRAPAAVLA